MTKSDFSELEALQRDFERSLRPEAEKVVKKGALNIKEDARAKILAQTRPLRTRHYRFSINFDMLPGGLSAEIGPDRSIKQGKLGILLEYGTVDGPPLPHLNPALDEEAPKFQKALQDIAEERILGRD